MMAKKDKKMQPPAIDLMRLDTLYKKVTGVIDRARATVYKTANFETVKGYWEIGRYIVEEEQHGIAKAEYGKYIIKSISDKLLRNYGNTFSRRNLEHIRRFYVTFPIANALSSRLTWTHYRSLLKVDNEATRDFYIYEAIHGNWGTRTLERAILTKLYERTLLAQKTHQLTSQPYTSRFYSPIHINGVLKGYAILSQLRIFDSKRLINKMGIITKDAYLGLKKAVSTLLC